MKKVVVGIIWGVEIPGTYTATAARIRSYRFVHEELAMMIP
jgi:hypothetical protein